MTAVPSDCVEVVARAIVHSFERGSPDIAAGMRMDWQTWVPEAKAAISAHDTALLARVRELEEGLSAAIGNMMNAKFDLEAGTKKSFAVEQLGRAITKARSLISSMVP